MVSQIVIDENVLSDIETIYRGVLPSKDKILSHSLKHEYVVFAENSAVSLYFTCSVMRLAQMVDSIITHVIIRDDETASFLMQYLDYMKKDAAGKLSTRIRLYHSEEEFFSRERRFSYSKVRVCLFVDYANFNLQDSSFFAEYTKHIKKVAEFAEKIPTSKLVCTEIIPPVYLDSDIKRISEREYEAFVSKCGPNSPEKLILACEEEIRKCVKRGDMNAVVTRQMRIFGSGISCEMVEDVLADARKTQKISLNKEWKNELVGANHVCYTVLGVHRMFVKGNRGNIYHLQQFECNRYDVVSELIGGIYMPAFLEAGVPEADIISAGKADGEQEKKDSMKYSLLCTKKANAIIPTKFDDFYLEAALSEQLKSASDTLFVDDTDVLATYDGKLEMIKQLEIEMAEEIKRICEKYNIKYFLVGGSLLGAVRHHGFIPWDDDLDVGMLRKDYEKFRKVAPKELNEKYSYQSYRTEEDSHYIFDKVRLKDTYFTTKFSEMFKMENGLFIDILVYDKTSRFGLFRKLHIGLLRVWVRAINIRWVNRPRRAVWYRTTKVLLPLMQLFPLKFYHRFFEFLLKFYRFSGSKWGVDGVGQNLKRGAFPIHWFDELEEIEFENTKFPIPKAYDAYLRHWYGNNYMELPPVEKRFSGHNLCRVDLGCYAAKETGDGIHCSDKRGELYDYIEGENKHEEKDGNS